MCRHIADNDQQTLWDFHRRDLINEWAETMWHGLSYPGVKSEQNHISES